MKEIHEILQIIGSQTRLRILDALSMRPRSVAELSRIIGVTQQGILKHLTILERAGFVTSWKAPKETGLVVKQLYRLIKPVKILVDAGERLVHVDIHIAEDTQKSNTNKVRFSVAGKTLTEVSQQISDDEYDLMRRMKPLLERERRIILEILDLRSLMNRVIKDSACTPFEEAILAAYTHPDREIEMANLFENLKINQEKALDMLENLKRRSAIIGN